MKKKATNKKKINLTQPIYDFQADDIFEIIVDSGISKKKATNIIQEYVDKCGLLDGNGYFENLRNIDNPKFSKRLKDRPTKR